MMLHLSAGSAAPFREAGIAHWVDETCDFLFRTYADYFEALGVKAADLAPMCQAVQTWGASSGCDADRHLKQLCCVAVSLGHRFWQDPRFRHYAQTTIENPGLSRRQAVAGMVEQATGWLDGLWMDDNLHQFGERLCALLVGGHSLTTDNLAYVLPGHAGMFTPENEAQLLAWLNPRLPQTPHRHQRMALVSCSLAFGTGWWRDPQYKHLAHHVLSQSEPQALVARILPAFRALA